MGIRLLRIAVSVVQCVFGVDPGAANALAQPHTPGTTRPQSGQRP
jgi:hypothetical protein